MVYAADDYNVTLKLQRTYHLFTFYLSHGTDSPLLLFKYYDVRNSWFVHTDARSIHWFVVFVL